MKWGFFVAMGCLAGCGARTDLGTIGAADAAPIDAHADAGKCSLYGTTPVKLADLSGPIAGEAAIEFAGANVYFVVKVPNAAASSLFSVPVAGGGLTSVATDVSCPSLASDDEYVAYAGVDGRVIAIPLAGGAPSGAEALAPVRCPIQYNGSAFYFTFLSNVTLGVAGWSPPSEGASYVSDSYHYAFRGQYILDKDYVYSSEAQGQTSLIDRRLLAPDIGQGNLQTLASGPAGSRLIGQTANELVFGPATGPVLRVAKSGGDPVKVTDAIGSQALVDATAIYSIGGKGLTNATLSRVRLADGFGETMAHAQAGPIVGIGVSDCYVAWIESQPPALMIRAK